MQKRSARDLGASRSCGDGFRSTYGDATSWTLLNMLNSTPAFYHQFLWNTTTHTWARTGPFYPQQGSGRSSSASIESGAWSEKLVRGHGRVANQSPTPPTRRRSAKADARREIETRVKLPPSLFANSFFWGGERAAT